VSINSFQSHKNRFSIPQNGNSQKPVIKKQTSDPSPGEEM